MARTRGGGGGAAIITLAVAAVPAVVKFLDAPENREQLRQVAGRAGASLRGLTPEGRLDKRISALRDALRRRAGQASNGQVQGWEDRLTKLEEKRTLLRGPFDARARRRYTRALGQQLDALWVEIVGDLEEDSTTS